MLTIESFAGVESPGLGPVSIPELNARDDAE
jgi:hypothetical protein